MSSQSAAEIEAQRQEALKRIRQAMGGISFDEAGFAPGTLGCHEALHAASIALDLVERQLLDHPSIVVQTDWYAKAVAAHQSLFDLYQSIGGAHIPDEPSGGAGSQAS